MNYSRIAANLRKQIDNHGLTSVWYRGALTTINSCVPLRVLKFITISAPNPKFLETSNRYRCGFLTPEQLSAFAKNSVYEISPHFLDLALAKGDECYGIVDGEVLASYGWYANTATTIDHNFRLSFDSQFMYMYKGYTKDDYRGQRLHAVGMTHALQAYLERGHKGLVSFVDGDNFDSLKSCYRMGYRDFGTVYIAKALGRSLVWHSAGCWDYHLRVEEVHSANIGFPTATFGRK